jgi:hypothetical protein
MLTATGVTRANQEQSESIRTSVDTRAAQYRRGSTVACGWFRSSNSADQLVKQDSNLCHCVGMRITALPTWYARCRYRSRLEARCAAFFDHIGDEFQLSGVLSGGGVCTLVWTRVVGVGFRMRGRRWNIRADCARRNAVPVVMAQAYPPSVLSTRLVDAVSRPHSAGSGE